MSIQAKTVKEIAYKTLEEEKSQARGAAMGTKLQAVSDACEDIVKVGGVPSVPGVIAWIATNRPGIKLAKRTIYNKKQQEDGTWEDSPYQRVINAWMAVQMDKKLSKGTPSGSKMPDHGFWVTNDDLAKIGDGVVRHKVATMLGQFRQIKNQAEMRKAIADNPPVPSLLNPPKDNEAIDYNLALDEDELDALADFIDEASAKRRGLEFNDVGTVYARAVNNGKPLTKPAFVEALEKIIKSYDLTILKDL